MVSDLDEAPAIWVVGWGCETNSAREFDYGPRYSTKIVVIFLRQQVCPALWAKSANKIGGQLWVQFYVVTAVCVTLQVLHLTPH